MNHCWDLRDIFIAACVESDQEKVRGCLDIAGDLLNTPDRHGWSALHYVSRHNKTDTLRTLMKQPGLDFNKVTLKYKTPLILASIYGHHDILRTLSGVRGLEVNYRGMKKYEWAALHYAVYYNDLECVKILSQVPGVDINLRNYDGNTPLSLALKNNHVDILRVLLAQPDLDLTVTDGNGLDVAHLVVGHHSGEALTCLELLSRDKRVDWNIKNQDGDTPIMHCMKANKTEMIRILMNVEGVDIEGKYLDYVARWARIFTQIMYVFISLKI